MTQPQPPFARFLEALPGPLREHAAASPLAEQHWSDGLSGARQDWPELSIDPGAFAEHVATRLASVEHLNRLSWSELYLAYACSQGDPTALSAFEERYLAKLGPALARIGLAGDKAEEVRQDLRVRLLSTHDREHPEIADYAGRGSLRGWLSVMAARIGRKMLVRERGRQTTGDDALLVVFDPTQDPALGYMKQVHRAHFKQAVARSLSTLSARERNLLRHHLVDGLSIDEIGLRYGVSRATAARWVAKARERLVGAARRLLMRQFEESRQEVDSMIQFVRSRIDLSLERLLAGDEPEE